MRSIPLVNVYKILLIVGLCVVHSPLYAHGIKYSLGSGGIVVRASFDNNQPANGLYVAVFAPGSSDKFQTGKSDLNGRFVFFPDRAGDWEVVAFDKMGHRLEIKIPVNEAMKVGKKMEGHSIPLLLKVVIGLSIIFGVFGLICMLKSTYRKK